MTPYTIPEIFAAFSRLDEGGGYRRKHVDAALSMRAEITPHLIALLQSISDDPAKYSEDEGFIGQLYAVMLLSYWAETSAHETIVKLFHLPEEQIDFLFGDLITEDLPLILYRTCGGSIAQIKALVLDSSAYQYCRGSALRALNYAVAEGVADRAEVIAVYSALLHPDAGLDTDTLGIVLGEATYLSPVELSRAVRQAFADGRAEDSFFIRYQDVIDSMLLPRGKAMESIRQEIKKRSPDDFHERMAWWAMFKPEAEAKPPKPAPKLTRQQRRNQERKQKKAGKQQPKK